MFVIRPITTGDYEAYHEFALTTHLGVTNLPKNPATLKKKLENSVESFKKEVKTPSKELYLFILEEIESGKKIGTCGIWAQTGITERVYYYRIVTLTAPEESHDLPIPKNIQMLQPISYPKGPTEIGGLYLLPEFRHGGLGRLLSLSRFLFIATFPERFDSTVLSNMRGVIDSQEHCPFWEAVGRHFLDMKFVDVMHLLTYGKEFIPSFLPKYPIYLSLLPQEAQQVIGKTHENTTPAFTMLLQEGFQRTQEVDIFDAGPIIATPTQQIRTIRESQLGKVVQLTTEEFDKNTPPYLVGNEQLDFRACITPLQITKRQLTMTRKAAEALKIKTGDTVRYVSYKAKT